MITVDALRKGAFLNTLTLEEILRKSYPKDRIIQSNFIGITNGGGFAYDCMFPGEDGLERVKVFVNITDTGELVADY
jgi:hypothetical protein